MKKKKTKLNKIRKWTEALQAAVVWLTTETVSDCSLGGYGAHPHVVPGGYTPAPGNYLSVADSYSNSFSSLLPSLFLPRTDLNIVACFKVADQDGSGFVDDKELQRALSSYNQIFSTRTLSS